MKTTILTDKLWVLVAKISAYSIAGDVLGWDIELLTFRNDKEYLDYVDGFIDYVDGQDVGSPIPMQVIEECNRQYLTKCMNGEEYKPIKE